MPARQRFDDRERVVAPCLLERGAQLLRGGGLRDADRRAEPGRLDEDRQAERLELAEVIPLARAAIRDLRDRGVGHHVLERHLVHAERRREHACARRTARRRAPAAPGPSRPRRTGRAAPGRRHRRRAGRRRARSSRARRRPTSGHRGRSRRPPARARPPPVPRESQPPKRARSRARSTGRRPAPRPSLDQHPFARARRQDLVALVLLGRDADDDLHLVTAAPGPRPGPGSA